jgi:hypothetical protein
MRCGREVGLSCVNICCVAWVFEMLDISTVKKQIAYWFLKGNGQRPM